MQHNIDIKAEIAEGLAGGRPIVALESTIISHGMPYPDNVETAHKVEERVRRAGALPATIAFIGGCIKVGLSEDELEIIGKGGHEITKASRRDLGFVMASGLDGATTVAATMLIAHRVGIKIFATGGIGGVHRGAENSMDISCDLEEFSRSEVAVVCAGAKAILDLPRTLEYLETKGIPLIGYQCDELPAFYTRESGLPLYQRADNPEEVASILRCHWELGLGGGLIIANPIPREAAMDKEVMDAVIAWAVDEATREGIGGKELTPFLLDAIKTKTEGRSLEANIALILNNALLAGEIAKSYSLKKN